MNDFVQILTDLISIQSDTDDKIKNIADYICSHLNKNNIIYERIKHTTNQAQSIIAIVNADCLSDINRGLVLSGHMDSVPGTQSQFIPMCMNGKIFGRGAVDMKYFIAVVMGIIPELKKLNLPILLAFTGDEETDVTGIKHICNFMKCNNIHPDMAIVGEPTNADIIAEHNGYCGYTTTVHGVPAHGSQIDQGINSIYAATEIIAHIKKMAELYFHNGTTINVGYIRGGTQRNTVAESTILNWEVRFSCDSDHKEIIESVKNFQNFLVSKKPGLKIETVAAEQICALTKKTNSTITKIISDVCKNKTIKSPIATEAGFLQSCGIDTVVFGAGDIKYAHTADEHIKTDDIFDYASKLVTIIKTVCDDINKTQ